MLKKRPNCLFQKDLNFEVLCTFETHMKIPRRIELEPAELKFFLFNGGVRVLFQDGSIWEVENASEERIPVSATTVIARDKIGFFEDEMAARIYYLLLLRPYHKLGLAGIYYNRKRNVARGRIDKAIRKLKAMGVLRISEWIPEFESKYDISPKSKYIYSADIIKPIRTILSDERVIKPEMEFLVNLFDVFYPHEFFFEWEVNNIREKNVDVFKLLKIKLMSLLLLAQHLQVKNHELWFGESKETKKGYLEIAQKMGVLFQYVDVKPVADYLFKLLLSELPPNVTDDLTGLVVHYMGQENDNVFKLLVFLIFLPSETIQEILDKLMSV